EKRDCRAHLEALAASYMRRHQLPIRSVVKQLLPTLPPAWTAATAGRDHLFAVALWEALHVDFIPARRVRNIGQPSPVGRESPSSFISYGPNNPELLRLSTTRRL